jgi:CheY-like chemotaxis protein
MIFQDWTLYRVLFRLSFFLKILKIFIYLVESWAHFGSACSTAFFFSGTGLALSDKAGELFQLPSFQLETCEATAMITSNKVVLVVNADSEESPGISRQLHEAGCLAQTVGSPAELKVLLRAKACMAVIMDIDSVAMNNRTIRELAAAFPAIRFLCLSKERHHPELKDSIRDHIYACLIKPIDPDELDYWLRCIREDDRGPTVG